MFKILSAASIVSIVLFACSANNVDRDDTLQQYFDEYKVTGTFAVFDNTKGKFTIYNLERFSDSAYLPASTFKIVNSLIAIETGVVRNDSAIIPSNGIGSRPECNKDLPMYEAFRLSCVPWYQELARRIGKDTMQRWLDTLGYASLSGKAAIGKIDTFWLDNSIKLTADEQLGLVKKLYFNQLPFKKWTQRQVKEMMLMDSTDKYKLSYKTGLGYRENGNALGWVVGWIEENRHPYPFVLQLESADTTIDMKSARMALLEKIFRHYGFKEGKK